MDHHYIWQIQSGQAPLQRVFYVINQIGARVIQALGQDHTLHSNGQVSLIFPFIIQMETVITRKK